jgi:hypothetical protein
LNPRHLTDRAVLTRSQLSPFVNDETAALRRGLAFERAHFSPDPLNGGSPDSDGRSRLVDACAAPQKPLDCSFRLGVDPRSPNRIAALGALSGDVLRAMRVP